MRYPPICAVMGGAGIPEDLWLHAWSSAFEPGMAMGAISRFPRHTSHSS